MKLEDDDKALMLLNSLSKSFENFKDTLLFGRKDQLSFEEIQTALKTKFLQMKSDKKAQTPSEGLNVKFNKNKNQFQKKKPGEGKAKGDQKGGNNFVEKIRCFKCHKIG